MILVDTSVWIDHLHRSDPDLVDALRRAIVLRHPMVVGELALGSIKNRESVLGSLAELRPAPTATHGEVAQLVESHRLYGAGLSLVDAHLLASILLLPGARLWTRDKRLHRQAVQLGVAGP